MDGRSTERRGSYVPFDLYTIYSRIRLGTSRGRMEDHLYEMEVIARMRADRAEVEALTEESRSTRLRLSNVSTRLSEEAVAKSLKQHKYTSMAEEERCCICQEEYVEGDLLGRLNCTHHFHCSCIKQWLAHKNLCPICRSTALNT